MDRSVLHSDGLPSIRAWDRGSAASLPKVGHRQLRESLATLLGRVHEQSGAVEVLNGGHQEVVVVAYSVFEDLVETARGADKLREAMSFLLAAAAAGVHIPSETIDRLGLAPAQVDAEATKRFRSMYPLTPTHGEDGAALAPVSISPGLNAIDDDEEELVYVDRRT